MKGALETSDADDCAAAVGRGTTQVDAEVSSVLVWLLPGFSSRGVASAHQQKTQHCTTLHAKKEYSHSVVATSITST